MASNSLVILGVHPYDPQADTFDQTVAYLYGEDLDAADLVAAQQAIREHFASLFVVEVAGPALSESFPWDGITQEVPDQPSENWQAPYDEQLIDGDRNAWAFFFHFLDPSRPLLTPSGPAALPAVTKLPPYLQNIEYEAP